MREREREISYNIVRSVQAFERVVTVVGEKKAREYFDEMRKLCNEEKANPVPTLVYR